MTEPDDRGATTASLARWQGQIEAEVKAIRRETELRDDAYAERATSQNNAVSAALAASDKAIDKAEENAARWRDSANEWRGAMSDRDRELPSRREMESLVTGLADRVKRLEESDARATGQERGKKHTETAQQITMGQIIAAVGVAVAALGAVAAIAIGAFT